MSAASDGLQAEDLRENDITIIRRIVIRTTASLHGMNV
jgi:hypothetical protein